MDQKLKDDIWEFLKKEIFRFGIMNQIFFSEIAIRQK
jgi:hypothetical protein